VSDGGTLRLVIQRVDSGRKIRGTCRATTRSNRAAKRCSRYLAVGAISRAVLKGDGTLRFTGRMRGRALRPGSYRLVAAIVGANGASSPSVARTFTVVASRR
jgi:hypothetical protein